MRYVRVLSASRIIQNFPASRNRWGGWGSNPRPADYEKYGPELRVLYLRGYHGTVPPMTLIAPFAWSLGPRTGPRIPW